MRARGARVAGVVALTAVLSALVAGVGGCGRSDGTPLAAWTGAAPPLTSSQAPPSPSPPEPAATPQLSTAPAQQVAEPPVTGASRLRLPSLDVDAAVVDIGVSDDLVLQVPDNPRVLGRWADGAGPGSGTGSIVIVGHVDFRGLPGALRRLSEIREGATATLTATDGQDAGYVVDQVDVYRKAALPYQEIFRADVPERLVLITCGGEFDRSTGHYDSNVVVYLRPA